MEDPGHVDSKLRSSSPSQSPAQVPLLSETRRIINDIIEDAPLGRIFNKRFTGFYLVFTLWLIWQLSSMSGMWSPSEYKPSQGETTLHNYFSNFEGYSECGLRAVELYSPPPQDDKGFYEYGTFCHGRKQLLKALSEGGRIGFDTPYKARGKAMRDT